MNKLRLHLLSTLYVVVLCASVPLLWCTSLSLRVECQRLARCGTKRQLLLLRVLAKHAAHDLGPAVVWFMLLPGVIGGALAHSLGAAVVASTGGLAAMALLPVLAPMPSREMADAAATGRRFIQTTPRKGDTTP